MKKTLTILCMVAAMAMLFTSCSGSGGGSSTINNLLTSVEGAWIEDDNSGGFYSGFYLSNGNAYLAATKDKSTIYYGKDSFMGVTPGTYTSSGSEVKITINGTTDTCTRNGETMTYTENGKTVTIKKRSSATIEAKTDAELQTLIASWMANP